MKYTIKAFIKEKNETVSSVAQKLHLSRPTFDTYILIYEEGKRLPKENYQKVFDSLFSNYGISSSVFKERLDMCSIFLEKSDSKDSLSILSQKADQLSLLMERLRKEMCYGKSNKDLYEFIDLLLSNYHNELFYNLIQYFLILDGRKSLTGIKELQVAYFANFYHAFKNIESDIVSYEISDWVAYKNECQSMSVKKQLQKLGVEKRELERREQELRRLLYENTNWRMGF